MQRSGGRGSTGTYKKIMKPALVGTSHGTVEALGEGGKQGQTFFFCLSF